MGSIGLWKKYINFWYGQICFIYAAYFLNWIILDSSPIESKARVTLRQNASAKEHSKIEELQEEDDDVR